MTAPSSHRFRLYTDLGVAIALNFIAVGVTFLFSHQHLPLPWIGVVAMLGVVIAIGQHRLPQPQSRSLIKPAAWILCFQALLYLCAQGIQLPTPTFLRLTPHLTMGLLYPWVYMVLIAIALRVTHAHTRSDTYIADLISQWWHAARSGQCHAILHFYMRLITPAILALTFTAYIIQCLMAYSTRSSGFSVQNLLLSLIPLILLFYRPLQSRLKWFVSNPRWLWLTLPLFSVLLAILLLSASHGTMALTQTSSTPQLIVWFNHLFNVTNRHQLYAMSWWLAWSVIGGVFIAQQCRRLSLVSMALITLILPITTALLSTDMHHIPIHTSPTWQLLIGLIALVALCALLFKSNMRSQIVIPQFSHQEQPKRRAFQAYLVKLLKTILILLFFCIPIGNNVLTYVACLISLPVYAIVAFSFLTAFKKDRYEST